MDFTATDLGPMDAREWPARVAGLQREGAPRLVVARLTGGVLTLGRWQLADVALSREGLEKRPIRRATGGRTAVLGEGLVSVALVLPHRSALVSNDPDALPAASFLNRAVRPLLGALQRAGVTAHYFGRDFVTVEGAQGALLGFDIDGQGRALLEAHVPCEAHWWPPEQLLARPHSPPTRGVPAPGLSPRLAGLDAPRLLERLREALRTDFGHDSHEEPASLASPLDLPPHAPFSERTGLVETALGVMLASWEQGSNGTIAAVRLHGDFLADSGGMQRIEHALAGVRPESDAIGEAIRQVLGDPAHALLGVTDLMPIVEALGAGIRGD